MRQSRGFIRRGVKSQLEAGVRYVQQTATYDDGSFAYANRIVGPFVKVLFKTP